MKNASLILAALSSFIQCSFGLISGENLTLRSTGYSDRNGGWTLNETGYAGTYAVVPSTTIADFEIEVSGTMADGEFPIMDIHIGGMKWTYHVVDTNQVFSVYGFDLPQGTHSVRIELTRGGRSFKRALTIHSFKLIDAKTNTSLISNLDDEVNALNAADSYADNWRRGDFLLQLKHSNGQPVEAGKQVRIKLKRHAFNFGVCVNGTKTSSKWLRGDSDAIMFRNKVTEQPMFSMLGCDNGAKWRYNEKTRDVETYAYTDAFLDFCEEHNMRSRWHTIMWGDHDPDWANYFENNVMKKIIVSGVTHPPLNGTYTLGVERMFGEVYTAGIPNAMGTNVAYAIYRWKNPRDLSEVKWIFGQSTPRTIYFSSTDPVDSPFDVTNWVAENGATGTPVFTHLNNDEGDRQELRDEISERIDAVVAQRGHRFHEVDGINESSSASLVAKDFGTAGMVGIYDEIHQAAVNASLSNGTTKVKAFINDYAILRGVLKMNKITTATNPGELDWYRNWYRRHVESFIQLGDEDTVGGIGIQGHLHTHAPDEYGTGTRRITLSTYRKPLETLAVLEKPIAITEFSLDHFQTLNPPWTDNEIYDLVNKAMRIVFGNDQTTTFHYWGFYDPWDGDFYGLYEADWSLSPIGQAWRDLTTQEWYTEDVLTVDEQGEVLLTNAYFGDYEVSGENEFTYTAKTILEADKEKVTVHGEGQVAINISQATASIPEGNSIPIHVFLNEKPMSNIVVSVSVTGDHDFYISPNSITFRPTTWNIPQTIQIEAAEDLDLLHGTGIVRYTASGAIDAHIGVSEIDNDILPYDIWREKMFQNPSDPTTDRENDFDADGWNNEQEYCFGMNPLNGTNRDPKKPSTEIITDSGLDYFGIKYSYRTDSGINYFINISTNLLDWVDETDSMPISEGPFANEDGTRTLTRRYYKKTTEEPRLFIRVKATE